MDKSVDQLSVKKLNAKLDEFYKQHVFAANQCGKSTFHYDALEQRLAWVSRKKVEGSLVFYDEAHPPHVAEPDRPTLADRLDKAEAVIKELEWDNATCRQAVIDAQRCIDDAWRRVFEESERAERAEAMAEKIDAMAADLEACRRALGTIRFEEITRR